MLRRNAQYFAVLTCVAVHVNRSRAGQSCQLAMRSATDRGAIGEDKVLYSVVGPVLGIEVGPGRPRPDTDMRRITKNFFGGASRSLGLSMNINCNVQESPEHVSA